MNFFASLFVDFPLTDHGRFTPDASGWLPSQAGPATVGSVAGCFSVWPPILAAARSIGGAIYQAFISAAPAAIATFLGGLLSVRRALPHSLRHNAMAIEGLMARHFLPGCFAGPKTRPRYC